MSDLVIAERYKRQLDAPDGYYLVKFTVGELRKLIEELSRAEQDNKALRERVERFRDGDNYIKQFLDAKAKCAAMYPPEEVYTKGQLELWAEENGYALTASPNEVKALREQVERLSVPVSPKIPVGVVTVCIADYPDQSVTEYFRTRNGDWVVIVDSGESLRFDDEGYFPHGERGSEVKSVLIFRVSYTSGGVKSEEWRVRGQSYDTLKDALIASRKEADNG